MPTQSGRSILGVLVSFWLLFAPLQARQGQKPAVATGLILGRVVEATTNAPVRDAIVQIGLGGGDLDMTHHAPDGESQPIGVLTDGDGQFVISGLGPGSYRLWTRRHGYREAPFGARRPNDAGEPLVLKDGERLGEVVLRLWKYAAITGVIADEYGDPVVGAAVRAYARTFIAGHPRLGIDVAYARTDDRGAYRLPRLIAGDYIVGVIRAERSAPAALIDARQAAASAADAAAIGEVLGRAGAYVAPPGTPDSVRRGAALVGLVPPVAPAAPDGWMTYPTQFYPGASGVAGARAVVVRTGEEVSGIDFRLRPVRTRFVSGTVVDADGPVARFPVRLMPAGVAEFEMEDQAPAHATVTDDAGRFVFAAVPPGDYVVRALRGVGGSVEFAAVGVAEVGGGVMISSGEFGVVTAEAPPPRPAEPTRYATASVSVGDRDVSGVAVTLTLGAPLRGAVEFIGRADRPAPPEFQAIGIVVEAIDGRQAGFDFEMTGQVDRTGRFETVGLPAGRYLVRVPRLPSGWSLESVQFEGRDVSDAPIEVSAAALDGLTIRLTERPSIFGGSVRASGPRDDLARTIVVVFPTDRARWRDYGSTPRRLRDAAPAADGTFEIRGLPPGEYFAAVIPDDFVREWRSPALLDALSPTATRVAVSAGGRASQTLTVTPVPSGAR